jgi:hypothetical protein
VITPGSARHSLRNPGTGVALLRTGRFWNPDEGSFVLLTYDHHAELDTFLADEDGRSSDKFSDLVLALAAKRAVKRIL